MATLSFSTVGLRDGTLASSSASNKRRMSTGAGILQKPSSAQKKKRRNVSFGGAHVRLFDGMNNNGGSTGVSVLPSPIAPALDATQYACDDDTMEFTQSHPSGIFLQPEVQLTNTIEEEETDAGDDMDLTRSHVFNIIQSSAGESTTDLAAYYKNAGEQTKEMANAYRNILQRGQDATEDVDANEDEEDADEDVISFKPQAEPVAPQTEQQHEQDSEPADETMNFTRSYTAAIIVQPAFAAGLEAAPEAEEVDISVAQEECTMDFTRSFTAAIITNNAASTTVPFSPLRFPVAPVVAPAPPMPVVLEAPEFESAVNAEECTMEFTRSFTSAIVNPYQQQQIQQEQLEREQQEREQLIYQQQQLQLQQQKEREQQAAAQAAAQAAEQLRLQQVREQQAAAQAAAEAAEQLRLRREEEELAAAEAELAIELAAEQQRLQLQQQLEAEVEQQRLQQEQALAVVAAATSAAEAAAITAAAEVAEAAAASKAAAAAEAAEAASIVAVNAARLQAEADARAALRAQEEAALLTGVDGAFFAAVPTNLRWRVRDELRTLRREFTVSTAPGQLEVVISRVASLSQAIVRVHSASHTIELVSTLGAAADHLTQESIADEWQAQPRGWGKMLRVCKTVEAWMDL